VTAPPAKRQGDVAMKTAETTDTSVLIAKAIVWVAGRAFEFVPVIGPVFRVVNFVNDVAQIRQAYGENENN
jgi:hypothetical protein